MIERRQISGSFKPHMMYDPKTGDSKMANKKETLSSQS